MKYYILHIGIVLSLGIDMYSMHIASLKELTIHFLTQKLPLLLHSKGIIGSGEYLPKLLLQRPVEVDTILLSRLILSSEVFWQQPCVHRTFKGHTKEVAALTFAPDATSLISAGADGRICVWDTQTNDNNLITSFMAHKDARITGLKLYLKEDLAVSSSYDGTVKFWEWRTGRLSKVFFHHNAPRVSCIDLNPTQTLLLAGCHDTNAYLWDIHEEKVIKTFIGHTGEITAVAFWADGIHAVTAARDRECSYKICVWNMKTGSCETSLYGTSQTGFASCIMDEGGRSAFKSSWSQSLEKFDIEAQKIVSLKQEIAQWRFSTLSLSKDGEYLLTAQQRPHQVCLWLHTGTLIKLIGNYSDTSRLLSLAISPNNVSFAGGTTDGQVYVWSWHPILKELETFERGLLIDMIARWCKVDGKKNSLSLEHSLYWYNHWKMLPENIKQVIRKNYMVGKEQSLEPLKVGQQEASEEA